MTALPQPADLDLRLVRYFTVVAQHLHFGRAAEVLRLAQPSLSRQIRRLEEQLGARLLDRTSQGTRLTEAGEVFLPQAKTLLRNADQAAARTRAAARPTRIVVGYTLGMIVTPAVREMRRRHPGAEVHATHLAMDDARHALLDGRADAVVSRLPFPTGGLQVTILYEEPRVLVVASDHRLAGKQSVSLDDIAGEPMPQVRGSDPVWSAYWRVDPRPDGSRAPGGPVIDDLEDKWEVVAAGQAVAIAAASHGRRHRPDVVVIPLEGVEPSYVALATRAGERNRLVAAFRACAQAELKGAAG
jgi:DNA-binding transcriptional LysR family regulator